MYQAYMIRNDGVEFPVKIHPYASKENVEETLYASQWLYNHTNNESSKKLVANFIKSFVNEYLGFSADIVNSLLKWQETLPYKVVEKDVIEQMSDEIENAEIYDLLELNQLVDAELNQEFMRVRLGGLVNSSYGSKELVFRISSVGFDWFNIIYMFVANNKRDISCVTIVKDEESTGYEDYFYSYKGEVYNKLPVDDFLTQSGRPVIEGLENAKSRALKSGKSLLEAFKNINYNRILLAVDMINHYEVKENTVWQKLSL